MYLPKSISREKLTPQKQNQILLLLCLELRGHKNILSTFCPFRMTHQEDKTLARESWFTYKTLNELWTISFSFQSAKSPRREQEVPDSTAFEHFTAIPVSGDSAPRCPESPGRLSPLPARADTLPCPVPPVGLSGRMGLQRSRRALSTTSQLLLPISKMPLRSGSSPARAGGAAAIGTTLRRRSWGAARARPCGRGIGAAGPGMAAAAPPRQPRRTAGPSSARPAPQAGPHRPGAGGRAPGPGRQRGSARASPGQRGPRRASLPAPGRAWSAPGPTRVRRAAHGNSSRRELRHLSGLLFSGTSPRKERSHYRNQFSLSEPRVFHSSVTINSIAVTSL